MSQSWANFQGQYGKQGKQTRLLRDLGMQRSESSGRLVAASKVAVGAATSGMSKMRRTPSHPSLSGSSSSGSNLSRISRTSSNNSLGLKRTASSRSMLASSNNKPSSSQRKLLLKKSSSSRSLRGSLSSNSLTGMSGSFSALR